ncbi:methyltransferase domain-containing protein [Limnobaculum zhutongyuii]|uniref:Methyltransferase domain-containing protein n=1 Tax=Limnobaculum zhutongyuii TaxID=2498113 RepID=A0A411WJH8_9GAMM|nr:methyltransferase domain-containing protein [Limnobaculum zhutongyuii]QBH96344.1 methyltransferase domain-containing protein [Limnobaculum zhutongyuii]TQS87067.1 methyltransferase domain-containing protein [Limnobaculum zhutongyuii]
MIISDIDFSSLYKNHMAKAGRVTKPASSWDAKAEKMAESCANPEDEYLKKFLSMMDLTGAKTLLDIGCGPGTICLQAANKLEHVYGLDYSAGMLEVAERRANVMELDNVTLFQRAWDDNWDDIPPSDIVVASRSTLVADMGAALKKLHDKALMRVYTTHPIDPHFMDIRILRALGRENTGLPNYIYPLNILCQMGINPRLDYIYSRNCQARTDSYEEFEKTVSWSLGELTDRERDNLHKYYQQGKNGPEPLISPLRGWAFISWDKNQGRS